MKHELPSRASARPLQTTCRAARGTVRKRRVAFTLMLAALVVATCSQAVTILTGPAFIAATNAPLAGTLQLTTDVPTRVSVSMDDGTNVWARQFYDYATTHSVPLLGFKPNRTNEITVTVYDKQWNLVTAPQPVQFVTGPLPTNFPSITLLHSEPDRMEPGYTLGRIGMKNETYCYAIILDSAGELVWYNATPANAEVRQLDNGDLFMPATTNFVEMNLLGQTVRRWVVPNNLQINPHEALPTDHGTILYLNNATMVVSNYPSNMTVSNAPRVTANVLYQKVVEISFTNGAVLNTWSPVNQLDPRRISYLIVPATGGWDSEHSNAVIEDPSDDSLIVSMRHQNAVIKFSRATGQLKWILGPPANWGPAWQPYLLKPVGTPFVWQYGQHSTILTPQGTLIMYDNGNYRASPFAAKVLDANNYSRAVEYSINEDTMEVSQVWDYGRTNVAERIYTDHEGIAEPEPQTGNVLIDFANVDYDNGVPASPYGPTATMVRLTEVTHDDVPQIVWDVAISMYSNTNVTYKDCSMYRCHRIPDLYAHPALPVGDLSISIQDGTAFLQFSADDARSYVVEASTDLVNWEQLGTAFEDEEQAGEFSFEETQPTDVTVRYYRVVTQ